MHALAAAQNQPQQQRGDRARRSAVAAAPSVWSLLALLALAIVVLIAIWDWNWFRGPIERQVQARTGREFHIRGNLDVDLGWTPRICAESVSFGNAAWSRQPVMADARRAELHIALRPLLRGQVLLPQITLERPRLLLETNPRGGPGNWVFGEPGQDRHAVPPRRHRPGPAALPRSAPSAPTSASASAAMRCRTAPQAAPVAVVGGGQWRGSAFRMRGNAASPLLLRDRDAPYRIDVRASAGATHAHARGTLLDPLRLRGFDLRMALSGRDMADLYPLLGLAIPTTPPYSLDGHFSRDGHHLALQRLHRPHRRQRHARQTPASKPDARARTCAPNLRSQRLDFDDLAGFVGGTPQAGRGETANPEQEAKAAARPGQRPRHPRQAVRAGQAARDGCRRAPARACASTHRGCRWTTWMRTCCSRAACCGCSRSTSASPTATSARPSAWTRAPTPSPPAPTSMPPASTWPSCCREVKLAQNAIGKVGGKIDITGTGNSVARMLGSSDGTMLLGMGRGQISNLLMEMAGIDLAEMIKFKLSGDRLIPVRCAFADFAVDDGVMTARSFAFDTTDTILLGSGTHRPARRNARPDHSPAAEGPQPARVPHAAAGRWQLPPTQGASGPGQGRPARRDCVDPGHASRRRRRCWRRWKPGPGEDSGCGGRYAK